jgi:hypothetical protein
MRNVIQYSTLTGYRKPRLTLATVLSNYVVQNYLLALALGILVGIASLVGLQ